MKNATIFSLIIAIVASIAAIATANESRLGMDYYEYADKLSLLEILDTEEVTCEVVSNRKGSLLIERVIGVVLDDEGNGEIFVDSPYNYISYKKVEGASKGDVICTYLVYDPTTNGEDDIIERFDFIIENGGENYEAHQ